ncbi:MAG: ribosome silencing factor [Fibrobacterota bacterium]
MPSLAGNKLASAIAALAEEAKGEEVRILDLRRFKAPAEYFVLITGAAEPHIKALSDHIENGLRMKATKPSRIEGGKGSDWRVLDFFDVMVHIFSRSKRAYYDIEDLYADAKKFGLEKPAIGHATPARPARKKSARKPGK